MSFGKGYSPEKRAVDDAARRLVRRSRRADVIVRAGPDGCVP